MGAYSHATPPLLKAIFFDYRFDLTKKTPPGQDFMGANCNVTPLLQIFLITYTSTTNFFNYYRFDLTNFDPPAKISRVQFVMLHLC